MQVAPAVRVDRERWIAVQAWVTEQMLYRLADMIDALTAAGPIYSQVLLPPDQMQRKRSLMEGGQ